MIGSGEVALERVLRETSAHYLLAVEPQEADRDGKLRELRVKVKERRSNDSQPTCGSSSRSAGCERESSEAVSISRPKSVNAPSRLEP